MMRNRWVTVGYLVLVFSSGSMVGAVANRLYMASSVTASTAPKTPTQARKEFLDKLRKRAGATEDQLARINAVQDEAKRRYAELELQKQPERDRIDQERVASVLAILNPEQQKFYLQLRAETRAKREQEAREQKALAEKADKAAAQQAPATQSR